MLEHPRDSTGTVHGPEHISGPLHGVLKELMGRVELRQRLEAERGTPISDEEFLKIAERCGGVEL